MWQRAKATWLAAKARSSYHTARSYKKALDDFEAFIAPLDLGQVGGAAVEEWANDMARRGLAPATISQRLAALSSFYEFCRRSFTDAQGRPLATFNPVAAVERPAVQPFGRSQPLSVEQARALLAAPDRSTICGARDYAILKMMLYTGRRSAEIRNLRWGDIQHTADGRVRYRWCGKRHKARWDDLPLPVYEAIRIYLIQAGRMDAIRPGDYIFVANGGQGDRPLSATWLNEMVKRYAREAGLPEWVHAHTLRHTAAALRAEAGEDVWEIGRLLGHSSPQVTRVYLNEMQGFEDRGWGRVQQRLEGERPLCWLDVIDRALCDLAAFVEDKYDERVRYAHGLLQSVLAGLVPMGRLLEVAPEREGEKCLESEST